MLSKPQHNPLSKILLIPIPIARNTLYGCSSRISNRIPSTLITGNISNQRVAVTIPEGFPDGMTVDNEGNIWVALWAGFKVTRWNPYTGKLLQSISVPAPNVTSCAFGGSNLNELYITTARKDLNEEALNQYPHAGSVFRVKTDATGMKSFEFVAS